MASDRKLTDLELERHLAGDLAEARFAEATDADRARLGELRAENEAFLRSVDVDMEVKRIHQRVERMTPPKRSWLRWFVPASALAAAAAVILVIMKRGGDGGGTGVGSDDLQVKGDEITLVVHLGTGAGSKRLTSGDTVHAGDRIRFELGGLKPGFVAVIGIDGSGQPTIYHPDRGTGPIAFDPANRVVPGAIELDATAGAERFFAVYSERPFAFEVVLPALATNGALPAGVTKAEVVLQKQ
jgi:hypothetical protein